MSAWPRPDVTRPYQVVAALFALLAFGAGGGFGASGRSFFTVGVARLAEALALDEFAGARWPFHSPSSTSTVPRESTTEGTPVTFMPSYRL